MIGFWSQGGTTQHFANELAFDLGVEAINLENVDFEAKAASRSILLIIIPTYDGLAPSCAIEQLKRLESAELRGLSFAVCGTGDNTYCDWFNTAAYALDKLLAAKGGHRLHPVGIADVQHPKGLGEGIERWGVALRGIKAIASLLPEDHTAEEEEGTGSSQTTLSELGPENFSAEMMEVGGERALPHRAAHNF